MRRTWPVLCFVLLVLLGVAIPVAYRQGLHHESEVDDALMALIQGQGDLEVLRALRAGDADRATKQIEARVWDVILPVHHYRDVLVEYSPDREEVETFLSEASLQFRNHPVVLGGVISKEEARRRADASAATNHVSDPELATMLQDISRTAAEANQRKHAQTREIVLEYLKKMREPQPRPAR